MIRRRTVIIVPMVILVLVSIGFIKVNMDLKSVRNKIEQHLLAEGYTSDEYQVKVTYHLENKLFGYNLYYIKVTYSNEPNINYYYDYNSKRKEIMQSGIAPIKDADSKDFKHAE